MKTQKKKGRPVLETGKRCRKIDTRFTEEEYAQIVQMETQLGIRKTDLIRKRVLDNASTIIINARELISQLDRTGSALGKAGNNINQLARHANTLQKQGKVSPLIVTEYTKLLGQWLKLETDLEATLRKIIRLMGR